MCKAALQSTTEGIPEFLLKLLLLANAHFDFIFDSVHNSIFTTFIPRSNRSNESYY